MKTTPFLCLILLIFSACNKNTKEAFDRKLMLENIGSKVIVPCFSELSQQSSKLLESLKNLQGEFSEDNLEKSRAQWKQYSIAWAECELFNFGAFKDTYLSTKIAAYPFKVSNMKRNIDEAGAGAEINGEFISSKGSNSKGMWAVEYLLFDKEGIDLIKNSPQYIKYLVALGEDLKTQSEKALEQWSVGNYSFLVSYVSKDDTEVWSSVSVTVNEMIVVTEKAYMIKLFKPTKKEENGKYSISSFEAWRSRTSLERLQANILCMKKIYENGLYSYLDFLNINPGAPLSEKIKKQFELIEKEVSNFSESLEETAANDPEKMNPLIESVKTLMILIKVDTTNQLGITVTLNDNDGD
ncbi:MAG: imelysin family protein [Lentisphaeraceae bacterium]|nr:imelysin family protein [Lentisphaeraceae bacterium]